MITELHLTDPRDTLKMLRETLCLAQGGLWSAHRPDSHVERIGRIIAEIDRQRPFGPDGKHHDLHTATCGCEDDQLARSSVRITQRADGAAEFRIPTGYAIEQAED